MVYKDSGQFPVFLTCSHTPEPYSYPHPNPPPSCPQVNLPRANPEDTQLLVGSQFNDELMLGRKRRKDTGAPWPKPWGVDLGQSSCLRPGHHQRKWGRTQRLGMLGSHRAPAARRHLCALGGSTGAHCTPVAFANFPSRAVTRPLFAESPQLGHWSFSEVQIQGSLSSAEAEPAGVQESKESSESKARSLPSPFISSCIDKSEITSAQYKSVFHTVSFPILLWRS